MNKGLRTRILIPALRGVLCLIILLSCSGCYVLKQARYLLYYQHKAEKISELMQRDSLSENTRQLLLLTKKIKAFSVEKLGLADDGNFSTYVHVDGKNIVHVVSASKPDRFEPYEWKFPFFGSFPYKGYFQMKDALNMAQKLEKKGYDVYVRGAGAYSTLGFFTDPIYSYMQEYSIYNLAAVIIHEQTHATIFLKNQVQFNEAMASFVGDEGALLFIRENYGENSDFYRNAILAQKDESAFTAFIKSLYNALADLYAKNLTVEIVKSKKQSIISHYKNTFENQYDSLFSTKTYKNFPQKNINNAYLTAYMTYTYDLNCFYELLQRNGSSLPKTISQLQLIDKKDVNPEESVRKLAVRQ